MKFYNIAIANLIAYIPRFQCLCVSAIQTLAITFQAEIG